MKKVFKRGEIPDDSTFSRELSQSEINTVAKAASIFESLNTDSVSIDSQTFHVQIPYWTENGGEMLVRNQNSYKMYLVKAETVYNAKKTEYEYVYSVF